MREGWSSDFYGGDSLGVGQLVLCALWGLPGGPGVTRAEARVKPTSVPGSTALKSPAGKTWLRNGHLCQEVLSSL